MWHHFVLWYTGGEPLSKGHGVAPTRRGSDTGSRIQVSVAGACCGNELALRHCRHDCGRGSVPHYGFHSVLARDCALDVRQYVHVGHDVICGKVGLFSGVPRCALVEWTTNGECVRTMLSAFVWRIRWRATLTTVLVCVGCGPGQIRHRDLGAAAEFRGCLCTRPSVLRAAGKAVSSSSSSGAWWWALRF